MDGALELRILSIIEAITIQTFAIEKQTRALERIAESIERIEKTKQKKNKKAKEFITKFIIDVSFIINKNA